MVEEFEEALGIPTKSMTDIEQTILVGLTIDMRAETETDFSQFYPCVYYTSKLTFQFSQNLLLAIKYTNFWTFIMTDEIYDFYDSLLLVRI